MSHPAYKFGLSGPIETELLGCWCDPFKEKKGAVTVSDEVVWNQTAGSIHSQAEEEEEDMEEEKEEEDLEMEIRW